ncbi:MAG: hypothetical protein Q8P67_01055 [archaeon]|nr:hypothetical protein [archaeon]
MYPDAAGIGTDTNAVVRLFPDAMQKQNNPTTGSELGLLFIYQSYLKYFHDYFKILLK